MGYGRALLVRWSRRDRLTVLVVAVATAFLVGSTLLLTAAGAQTATIADEFDSTATVTHYDSYTAAQDNATAESIVFPTVMLTRSNGSTHRFVGIPPDAPEEITNVSVPWRQASIPSPNRGVQGPVETPTHQHFTGPGGTATFKIVPHESNSSLFPPRWYVANASIVRALGGGESGAFVLETEHTNASGLNAVPDTGVPILSALIFLLAGMRELLTVLLTATIGGAVLILVVVYNVLRMTVRDRIRMIQVIRATGGSPRRVLSLFGLRAGLIVTVGVALGYALGIIITHAIVNVAVYVGLPIALTLALTPLAVKVLLPMLFLLVFVGIVAGLLAAWPATTCPPARLGASVSNGNASVDTGRHYFARVRRALAPTLLDWRAVVPTMMTLAVFAVVVVLVTSFAGMIAPLANPASGAIVEDDAAHVINSRVDTDYASLLRSQGIAASPELILTATVDGQPFLVRGANYTAFASITNVSLHNGHPPHGTAEAVIGADLAETLGVEVGDSLTLGGSLSPGLTRVTIVGEFTASGIVDDQLIVSLPTAHHLSIDSGQVQLIRVGRGNFTDINQAAAGASKPISVISVSAPATVPADEPLPVTIRLRNLGRTDATRQLTVALGNVTRTRSVTLSADEQTQIRMNLSAESIGNHTLRVETYTQSVRVLPSDALQIPSELPTRAPPNSTLFVPVITADEQPVANATLRIGNTTVTTSERGIAKVRLPSPPGTYTLVASKGNRSSATHQIEISPTARRQFAVRLQVRPKTASVLARPKANVTVANPWDATLNRTLMLVSPAVTRTRNVSLEPGESARITVNLIGSGIDERVSPGTYTVRVVSDGETLAETEYTIKGDDRLFSALASTGQFSSGGAGVGRAIQSIFGNIQLLLVAMVVLAGLTTVGSTTATFAQVVHARRQTIGVHRATGATYRQVLTTVLTDVCVITIPATVLAIVFALIATQVLGAMGLLTVFGIQLSTTVPIGVLIGTAIGSFLLAVLGAAFAAVPFLITSPTMLLTHSTRGSTESLAPRSELTGEQGGG